MRPEVDEAKAEAEAKADSHEAEAEIALFFSAKFYSLTQFSPKIHWSTCDGTSKCSAQNGRLCE